MGPENCEFKSHRPDFMCDFCDNEDFILTQYEIVKNSEPLLDDQGNVIGVTFGELGAKHYCLECGEKLLNWKPRFLYPS